MRHYKRGVGTQRKMLVGCPTSGTINNEPRTTSGLHVRLQIRWSWVRFSIGAELKKTTTHFGNQADPGQIGYQ